MWTKHTFCKPNNYLSILWRSSKHQKVIKTRTSFIIFSHVYQPFIKAGAGSNLSKWKIAMDPWLKGGKTSQPNDLKFGVNEGKTLIS